MNINQEQLRKIGCLVMAIPAVVGLLGVRGFLTVFGTELFGTITVLQVISIGALYFVYRVFQRGL